MNEITPNQAYELLWLLDWTENEIDKECGGLGADAAKSMCIAVCIALERLKLKGSTDKEIRAAVFQLVSELNHLALEHHIESMVGRS